MNSIIIKSFLQVHIYLFVCLILVLSSCYTQVDISSLEKSKTVINPFQNEAIDPDILGTWQKKIIWMDGPVQTQQLIFDTNHNILFEEYSGSSYGNKLSGSFKTKDSLLIIMLDYGYGTEKYSYKVAEGKLTLLPIEMDRHYPYKISGSGGVIWENPYYNKGKL